MSPLTSVDLLPIHDWRRFEEFCADLFEHEWDDQHLQRVGRTGQRQGGLDILGHDRKGRPVGIQCKQRSSRRNDRLREADILEAIAEAARFYAPISHLIIATTLLNDRRAQEHSHQISQERLARGEFSVEVDGWDELARKATLYPKIIEKHFHALIRDLTRDEALDVKEMLPRLRILAEQLPLDAVTRDQNVERSRKSKKSDNEGITAVTESELAPLSAEAQRLYQLLEMLPSPVSFVEMNDIFRSMRLAPSSLEDLITRCIVR